MTTLRRVRGFRGVGDMLGESASCCRVAALELRSGERDSRARRCGWGTRHTLDVQSLVHASNLAELVCHSIDFAKVGIVHLSIDIARFVDR